MPARRPETIARLRARDAGIVAMHLASPDLTLAQIGIQHGLSESMVCLIITRHRPRLRPSKARLFRLAARDRRMLEASQQVPPPTLATLAKEFGISASSVSRALKRANKCLARQQGWRGGADTASASPAPTPISPAKGLSTIDRDPGPRCAVRGDIGCTHRSAK